MPAGKKKKKTMKQADMDSLFASVGAEADTAPRENGATDVAGALLLAAGRQSGMQLSGSLHKLLLNCIPERLGWGAR